MHIYCIFSKPFYILLHLSLLWALTAHCPFFRPFISIVSRQFPLQFLLHYVRNADSIGMIFGSFYWVVCAFVILFHSQLMSFIFANESKHNALQFDWNHRQKSQRNRMVWGERRITIRLHLLSV